MCQLMFLNKHVIVMLQSNVHDFLSIDKICVFEAFTAKSDLGHPGTHHLLTPFFRPQALRLYLI